MYNDALIVDSFAGGGGASTGIELALDRSPDIAINHNPVALAMHAANHPETLHISENVWKVDPLDYLRGKHIGLAWFSPDCKHFSKAKGGKPVERNIRDLAWIIPGWTERIQKSGGKVDVIILENVEEFKDWGPLVETVNGLMPCPENKGKTFQQWCRKLRALGAKMAHRELRGCDYGAPTKRKRLFIIARFDGKPIVWPKPTHGAPDNPDVIAGRLKPYPWVAGCIDWSLPCPSIFATRKEIKAEYGLNAIRPMADASMSRVAHGVHRYVIRMAQEGKRPFLVNLTHHDKGDRCEDVNEPANTITGAHRGEKALVAPSITKFHGGSVGHDMREPAHTISANSFHKKPGGAAPMGMVAPVLSYAQQGGMNRPVDAPAHTITASSKDQNAVITPLLVGVAHGDSGGKREYPATEPLGVVQPGGGNQSLVAPYLVPRYGERDGQEPRTMRADAPAGTIVPTSNQGTLAAVYLAQNNTGVIGHDARTPMSTMVQKGCTQSVVETTLAPSVINFKGSDRADSSITEPAPTACASTVHAGIVAPVITKYYSTGRNEAPVNDAAGTITASDRMGLIEAAFDVKPLTDAQMQRARQVADFLRSYGFWDEREFVTIAIDGVEFVIVDIGMRMLTPRELFLAQGFPADYIIDLDHEGRALSKSDQIACCGNSVCPPVAEALVAANCNHLRRTELREAA